MTASPSGAIVSAGVTSWVWVGRICGSSRTPTIPSAPAQSPSQVANPVTGMETRTTFTLVLPVRSRRPREVVLPVNPRRTSDADSSSRLMVRRTSAPRSVSSFRAGFLVLTPHESLALLHDESTNLERVSSRPSVTEASSRDHHRHSKQIGHVYQRSMQIGGDAPRLCHTVNQPVEVIIPAESLLVIRHTSSPFLCVLSLPLPADPDAACAAWRKVTNPVRSRVRTRAPGPRYPAKSFEVIRVAPYPLSPQSRTPHAAYPSMVRRAERRAVTDGPGGDRLWPGSGHLRRCDRPL
jgi:hypothetical protein